MLLVVARSNAGLLLLANRFQVSRGIRQVTVDVVLAGVRTLLWLLPEGGSRCGRAESSELDSFLLGDLFVLLKHALAERRKLLVVDIDVGSWPGIRRLHNLVARTLIAGSEGNLDGLFLKKALLDLFLLLAVEIRSRSWVLGRGGLGERRSHFVFPHICAASSTQERVSVLSYRARVFSGGAHLAANHTRIAILDRFGIIGLRPGQRRVLWWLSIPGDGNFAGEDRLISRSVEGLVFHGQVWVVFTGTWLIPGRLRVFTSVLWLKKSTLSNTFREVFDRGYRL